MITIKKIENGYGIFDGDRLVDFAERQQDYEGLVDTVITVNTKLEIERIKGEIEDVKRLIIISACRLSKNFSDLKVLSDQLHWLENYNV